MISDDFIGVVLCGGKSTRMGRDKGTILKDGKSWAEIVRDNFTKLGLNSVVSINKSQQTEYSKIFSSEDLIIDGMENCSGPLNGLLTIHQKYPKKHIFLIATDMIDVNSEVISPLLDDFIAMENKKSIAWIRDAFIEPMCAIYACQHLNELYNHIVLNNPDKSPGLNVLFRNYPSVLKSLPEKLSKHLNNYNKI